MPRRRIEKTRADELLDELLEDYQGPEAILGKDGLLKQLSKRLVERALQAATEPSPGARATAKP